jgi:hypothetical protein
LPKKEFFHKPEAMKARYFVSAVFLVLAFAQAVVAQPIEAAKKPKAPLLPAFAGNYTGTLILTAGTTTYTGSAQGRISASKKKETGSASFTASVTDGMSPVGWAETFRFNAKNYTYQLVISSTSPVAAIGSGRASIKKKVISYNGTFTAMGATFLVNGTMRKIGKKSLQITETITGPTTITLTYFLRKSGK